MATRSEPRDPKPRTWPTRLPVVSVVAFASLALVVFRAYESAVALDQWCLRPGIEVPCIGVSPLWPILAGTWAISAVAVAVLVGVESHLARQGRTIGTPNAVLLAFGFLVSLLGVAWLSAAPWAGSGSMSVNPEFGLHIAYVTSALLFFAVTFVDFDDDRLPSRGRAAVLAVVNAGFALTAGVLWPF